MRALALIAALLLTSTALAVEWNAPLGRTSAKAFLRDVSLGIDKAEVAGVMGIPAKEMTLGGKLLWQYDFTYAYGQVASYVFTFENEKLLDVSWTYGKRHYTAIEEQAER